MACCSLCRPSSGLLFSAVSSGDAETLRTLLAAGGDANARNGEQPLLGYAAKSGRADCLCVLLECGAELEARDGEQKTALLSAVRCHKTSCIESLLLSGADITATCSGRTCLHWSCVDGAADVAELLLTQNGGAALLEARTKPNGSSALHLAASRGRLDCVRALLRAGCQLDSKDVCGRTPLYVATRAGKVQVVRLLLERGAVVDERCSTATTPLSTAVQEGRLELCVLLLDSGAAADAADEAARTPLHHAARQNKLDICVLLLARSASADLLDNDGLTPLMWAARRGALACAGALLKADADVHARAPDGWTALHWAAAQSDGAEMVSLLLRHGARPDACNVAGEAAAAVAASDEAREALTVTPQVVTHQNP
jgi:ankyrin repeat protein